MTATHVGIFRDTKAKVWAYVRQNNAVARNNVTANVDSSLLRKPPPAVIN